MKRTIAGEILLVPTTGELANLQKLFVLDPVGELVWEQIDGRRDIDSIARVVTEEFDVDLARARTDIEAYIDELMRAGLVVEATDDNQVGEDGAAVSADDR